MLCHQAGMPASAALEVTSWAKERIGISRWAASLPGHTFSRRLAALRIRRAVRSSPTRDGQFCGGQDVRLMIKTCFYTINYVLCKQRVVAEEYWIWRVGTVSTITGTITHKQRTPPTSTGEYPHFCRRTYFLLFIYIVQLYEDSTQEYNNCLLSSTCVSLCHWLWLCLSCNFTICVGSKDVPFLMEGA